MMAFRAPIGFPPLSLHLAPPSFAAAGSIGPTIRPVASCPLPRPVVRLWPCPPRSSSLATRCISCGPSLGRPPLVCCSCSLTAFAVEGGEDEGGDFPAISSPPRQHEATVAGSI